MHYITSVNLYDETYMPRLTPEPKGEIVTFQITVSTYIREGPGQRVSSPAFLP